MAEGSLLAWGGDMAGWGTFPEGFSSMGRILETKADAQDALMAAQRVAVIGIKPESHASEAAHYVPSFMKRVGFEIVPIPVYYPDVTEILGEPVYRKLADVPGELDLVVVFRRSRDVLPHVDDIIAKGTKTVWMQLGIQNAEAAERLTAAGIDVVQNRCAMIDYRS